MTDCTLRVVDIADKPAPHVPDPPGTPEPGPRPEHEALRDSGDAGVEPSGTDGWLLAFAAALAGLAPSAVPDTGLSRGETGMILHLARDVAHGAERRFAPLAAYLTGRFVTGRVQQGATVEEALAEARSAAARLLEQRG